VISIELARELKEAGLKPVCGECESFWIAEVDEEMYINGNYSPEPDDVWLPRLDQLLTEIEKQGWYWEIGKSTKDYYVDLMHDYLECDKVFYADTPEEAAGSALLWILRGDSEWITHQFAQSAAGTCSGTTGPTT